jgi:hypothetical protein
MWEAEKEFEILEEVEQYDLEDEITDEFPYPELEPSADEDNDDFEYEGDVNYDEEDD